MDLETIAKGTLPSLPPHLPQKPLPNLPQVNARHFASKPNSQNSYPELHQDLEERDSVKTSYSSLGRQKTANGRNMESTAEYEKRMSDLLSELDVEDDGVQVKYNNIPTNTPSKSLYRKSDAYNLLPKMSVSSLHFFGEEDEDEEEQIADYKKLKKSKSNSSISSLNTIIKNTEKTGSNHSLDTSHGVLKKSPSSTKSLNSINESSSISALSRTKTTKFSLKHEVALKDSNIFQDATNQILRNLSLRKESPMLVSTLKTFGICTTLIFTEEGICHRVEISPKITINEILMEILSYYGEIDSFGQMDFKMHLVEGLKETAIDTNYPICYFQKDVDSPPVFQLKYKPTKWVISIELPAERSRKLIVGKDTTVQYVIDLMNVIEDCSESGYGLFCEIGDERKFLESHLKPFNFPITGSFSFISASDVFKVNIGSKT